MNKAWIIVCIVALLLAPVPVSYGTTAPIVVTGINWYSSNNTVPVAPGYTDVPLIATFVSESSLTDLNVSFNFNSSGNRYFAYSYVHGPNKALRDYYNFPVTSQGVTYSIYQLTNVSPDAPVGIYSITLSYSFMVGNTTFTGNVSGQVALLGKVDIIPQNSYFGLPGNPVPATAYESGIPLTVYMENNGNSAATNVTVTYSPQLPFSGSLQRTVIPAFPSFSSIPITFFVDTGPSGFEVTQDLNVSVFGVTHVEKFTVRISSFPYIVGAGAEFNTGSIAASSGMKNIPLEFYLEEDSSVPVTNVSVLYSPTFPLSGVTQGTVVSAIPAYTAIPVTFLVNITGTQSSFNQNLTLLYNNSSHNVQFKVIVPGYSNISVVNYYTSPFYVYQEEQFITMNVALINGGNSLSQPLNISLSSNSFNISTHPFHIPALRPGQLLNLTFLMNASNSSGPAVLMLRVNNQTFILNETILNRGSVSISSPPILLSSGTNGNLFVFNVKNTGNVTMKDLNFHILVPDIFYINIPSSNPLGGLTANNVTFAQLIPGQSIKVTFVMDVESSAAPGTYPSQIIFTYMTNNSTRPFIVTHDFNVTVKETAIQQLSSTTGLTYVVLALAVVIVIVFSVLIIRRRKRRNKT